MTTPVVSARVVQKVIAILGAVTDISNYVGTRIYGAHISTIQDRTYPAISIMLSDTPESDVDGIMGETVAMQIDVWMNGTGPNGKTWDNVVECIQAIKNALHRVRLSDSTIGIHIIESSHLGNSPQLPEENGAVLHMGSRFRMRATI